MSAVFWILTTLVLAAADTESADTNAEQKDLELCRKQYVDAKDCQKWIADNLARSKERMDDEQKQLSKSGVSLTLHKVTDSELRRCHEQYVDDMGCQEWIAEQSARKQVHQSNKTSDKKQSDAKKNFDETVDAELKAMQKASLAEKKKTSEQSAKTQPTSAPSGKWWWPLMLVNTNQMANVSNTTIHDLCRSEHVSEKDCEKWVADEMARKAARKADEEARKNARHADEEARKAARRADEEARKAHEKSSNRTHEADDKSQTTEPAILLSIEKVTTQPTMLLFAFFGAVLIAMTVVVKGIFKEMHMRQSMKTPLLEESSAEV